MFGLATFSPMETDRDRADMCAPVLLTGLHCIILYCTDAAARKAGLRLCAAQRHRAKCTLIIVTEFVLVGMGCSPRGFDMLFPWQVFWPPQERDSHRKISPLLRLSLSRSLLPYGLHGESDADGRNVCICVCVYAPACARTQAKML